MEIFYFFDLSSTFLMSFHYKKKSKAALELWRSLAQNFWKFLTSYLASLCFSTSEVFQSFVFFSFFTRKVNWSIFELTYLARLYRKIWIFGTFPPLFMHRPSCYVNFSKFIESNLHLIHIYSHKLDILWIFLLASLRVSCVDCLVIFFGSNSSEYTALSDSTFVLLSLWSLFIRYTWSLDAPISKNTIHNFSYLTQTNFLM